jgi:O-antigen/teichoic acid export membrane protein
VSPSLTADNAVDDDEHERHRRGTRQILLGRGCFFVSAYLVSAILARKLGAVDYGTYGVIMSQLLWVETVANSGIPATAKLMADGRHDAGQVERSAEVLLVGVSILLFGLCWVLAPTLADVMRIPNGEVLFRIAAFDLPFAAVYASYEASLYGHRRFGVLAAAQVGFAVTRLLGAAVLFGLGFSVERMLFVVVLSTVLVYAALAFRRRTPRRPAAGRVVRQIAAIAAPIAVYLIGTQVLVSLDLWSLKTLWRGGGEVVGQYVASANLARILTLIPSVQAGVLFSSVAWALASRDTDRARKHVQESTRFALVISVAACVILGGDGSQVLSGLFSEAYADGYRFLRLQLVGFGLFALLDVFCCSLMAAGRQWLAAGTLVTIIPAAWASNYLLIPRLGPIGAAISMLVATGAAAGVAAGIASRQFGPVVRISTVARVSIAAIVVGILGRSFEMDGSLVILKLALLSAVYLVVLYATGEITGKDFGVPMKDPRKCAA